MDETSNEHPFPPHAVHSGITEIPGSHDYIHGEKVAFSLLTQLVLEGQPQSEINEILHYQKAVERPISWGGRWDEEHATS